MSIDIIGILKCYLILLIDNGGVRIHTHVRIRTPCVIIRTPYTCSGAPQYILGMYLLFKNK